MDKYYILSTQNNDNDDLFSIGNEDEKLENNKGIDKLIRYDCENSLSISSDIENVSAIRNSKIDKEAKNKDYGKRLDTPTGTNLKISFKDRNLRKSDEILKYIADNSEMYEESPHKKLNNNEVINSQNINLEKSESISYDNKYRELLLKYNDVKGNVVKYEGFHMKLLKILQKKKEFQNVSKDEIGLHLSDLLMLLKKFINKDDVSLFCSEKFEFTISNKKRKNLLTITNFDFELKITEKYLKTLTIPTFRGNEYSSNKSNSKENIKLNDSKLPTENGGRKKSGIVEDLTIFSTNFNLLSEKKLFSIDNLVQFDLNSSYKNKISNFIQTKITSADIDKLSRQNDEYCNQIVNYRIESSQDHKFFENQLKSIKRELIMHNNYENLEPEMIPPHKSFQIFIYCLKHLRFEKDLILNNLENKDIKYFKEFCKKIKVPRLKNNETNFEKKTDLENEKTSNTKEKGFIYKKYKELMVKLTKNKINTN